MDFMNFTDTNCLIEIYNMDNISFPLWVDIKYTYIVLAMKELFF